MADIKTENFKKNVEKLTAQLRKDLDPLVKQLDPILAELKALKAKKGKSLSMRGNDDDKKKTDEFQKKAADIRKKMEQAMSQFRLNLALQPDSAGVDKKELTKLGSWVSEVIERKGIPVSKNVTLGVDDLGFDFGKMKPTSGTITLTIEF
jgi:Skp family chaperone for outer membrane proteins